MKKSYNIYNKTHNKYLAFSLIEIMVGMSIIIVLAAAFAPNLSRKIEDDAMTVSGAKVTSSCDHIDSYCSICKGNECLACERDCDDGTHINLATCKCVN